MKAKKTDFLGIFNKLKSIYIVEALIILVGALLRLKLYLFNPSFFIDECALGFNIVNKSYSQLFSPLALCQCAPPFFLVVSKFILNLSHQYGNLYTQDLALRAFPLFCSIMSLPLFAIFLNKITDNKIFVWVCTAMLSLNTCAINYSIQFKQYSTELMFSLILLLIFQSFDINKLSKKALALYSLIICVSIWFSNTAFIILVAGFIYFILKCFSCRFRSEIKSNLSKILVLFIPFIINLILYYYLYFKGIYGSYINDYMKEYWTTYFLSFFSFTNFLILFPAKLQDLINIPCVPNIFINIFLLINIVIFLSKKTYNFKTKFLILTPIFASIVLSLLNIYPFERRLILFSLPLYIILYCQIISFIKQNKIFKTLVLLVLAVILVYKLTTPIKEIYYPYFYQPVRNIVEFILQNKIPSNKIIITSDKKEIDYYMRAISPNNKILLYDVSPVEFKNSKIKQTLKRARTNNDYYIFIPYCMWFLDSKDNLIKYVNYDKLINMLNNDKHIKILNSYSKYGYFYIFHIKKISNY